MNKEIRLQISKHLNKMVQKASSGMGEDSAAIGGYLTQPEILRDILTSDWMEGTIYDLCKKVDVSEKANGLWMNISKQATRNSTTGILGGFIAYHIDEGVAPTFTKGQFDQSELSLHQLGVICRVTNALLQDSVVLTQFLGDGLKETLRFFIDREILYGDGSTGCNGILNTGDRATKYIAIANPITIQNLKDMVGSYYGGEKGCWVMGRDMFYEVENLFANTLPLQFNEYGNAMLFGYPIIRKDNMNTRHIVLGDFSQYLVAQKPIREAISEHLYFDSNETVFRSIFRMNGMPTWYTSMTEESGKVVWPFVCTQDADSRSSSSSSSSSVSSESSSSNSSSSESSDSSSSISSLSSESSSSHSNSSESSSSSLLG